MRRLGLHAFGLVTALAVVMPASVRAEAETAEFRVTVAGIPVGTARLRVTVGPETYRVEGDAAFRFLFWGGSGRAEASGLVSDGGLRPDRYRLAYEGTRRPGGAEIAFDEGVAVAFASFPEPPAEIFEGRIDIAPDHLAGVLDPLSAFVIPAAAGTRPEDVCRRVLPVFNGFTRFDFVLGGVEGNGPDGLRCAVRYRPVSGHRPDSAGVRRMMRPGAFEVALAPLGEAAWAPARIAVQTRFGTVEIARTD